MRPRVFPAEDTLGYEGGGPRAAGFNEAAGIPRGRRRRPYRRPLGVDRFNEAAGIPRGRHARHVLDWRKPQCFNEAAGIPRGRHDRPPVRHVERPTRFNEAAGIPRGRHQPDRVAAREVASPASMRPRVFPAEDASVSPTA